MKTMLDGVVEAHTAAMLAPYTDDPTQSGKLFWDPDKYKATIANLDARGLQIFTHAIGDKAVRLALDAYQNAAAVNHTKDSRPRIEHIETITAARMPNDSDVPMTMTRSSPFSCLEISVMATILTNSGHIIFTCSHPSGA